MKSKKSLLSCVLLAVMLLFENVAGVPGGVVPAWAAGESISLEQFVAASKHNNPNDWAYAMPQQSDGGGGATALGYNAKAKAAFATALGWGAYADREWATAIGSNSSATGDYALAAGYENIANKERSIALGYQNNAKGNDSTAVGSGNKVDRDRSAAFGADNNVDGTRAIALGSMNEVKGEDSVAVGSRAVTEKNYSVAIGSHAVTNNQESVAIGRQAETLAAGSVAVGMGSRAKGLNSLALGSFSSSAKNDYAVNYCKEVMKRVADKDIADLTTDLERGLKAIATEELDEWLAKDTDSFIKEIESYIPGGGSFENTVMLIVAYDDNGVMEGTTASGVNAIAIGASTKPWGNTASGANSIAIGTDAQATAEGSVAIGTNSLADAENTVSVGNSTLQRRITNVAAGTADTDAVNLAQVNELIAAGGGTPLWEAGTGTNSIVMKGGSNSATKIYAVAFGLQNTASGEASTAIGFKSTAGGNYSLAVGYGAKTSGGASFAAGSETFANGYAAIALGQQTEANTNAVALGYKTKAEGRASIATGYGSEAYGQGSFAGGGHVTGTQVVGGKAYGESSFAFGTGAVAGELTYADGDTEHLHPVYGGDYTFAFGNNALASRDNAIALGSGAQAVHANSVALGSNSVTIAENTVAIGDVTNNALRRITGLADGVAATDGATVAQVFSLWEAGTGADSVQMAVGNNVATKINAVAMGNGSTASGEASVAMGLQSTANGNYSLAAGYGATTSGGAAVSAGANTNAKGYAAVALGQDTEANTNAVALGYGTKAEGRVSTATGYGSEALGEGSFAGGGKVTMGDAMGAKDGGKAYGISSFAFGMGAIAGVSGSEMDYAGIISLGNNAKAIHKNSVALGNDSVTVADNTLAIGDGSTVLRRITGVAEGTADTDAVTVGQLKAKSDYYVKGGGIRFDSSNNKHYLDLNIYNNTGGAQIAVDTLSIDMSGIGGGSAVSGDKILTAGANIGFTEYVEGGTTKYAVGLMDNITGIKSILIGTENKNIYLDDDGVTVTGVENITSRHKAAGITTDSFYIGEGQLNAVTGSYEGVIYSSLGKDELKVNQKTYINGNGIDANSQKIVNVAAGTTDTDAANYGQVKNAFTSASLNGNVLTLSPVAGNATNIDLSSLIGSGGGGTQSEADDLVHKGTDTGRTSIIGGAGAVATGENALAFGNNTQADAKEAVAVGYGNKVTGERSTAVGNENIVSGSRSGAFGDPNNITGTGSYAVGNDNIISGNNSFVLGNNVNITSNNSVVLGNNSADGGENTVSVGAPGSERRIVNVARAIADTDAVNLSQVNALLGTTGTGEAFYALQDEVAGMQNRIDRMGTRINKVGAGAAALAAMHPVYDEDCKMTFSAGLGAYRNEKAAAVGMFYRFSDRIMMNCGAAVGNDNNMYNIGINFALDKVVGAKLPSKEVMAKRLNLLKDIINLQDEKIAQQDAKLLAQTEQNKLLGAKVAEQGQQIAKLMAMVEELCKGK